MNFEDLLVILSNWGGAPFLPCSLVRTLDLDGSGDIDFGDLLQVLSGWDEDGCGGVQTGAPQDIIDCITKFGYDPVVLQACIEKVTSGQ